MELDDLKSKGICAGIGSAADCVSCLKQRLNQTPIEILADAFLHLPHLYGTAKKILDAYEGFLGILSNETSRKRLEELDSDSYGDETFDRARMLSHDFRDGLMDLFFDQKSGMLELTKNYGVF